jgi:RNA polymerase sigma-70 factor (sigma-E family)
MCIRWNTARGHVMTRGYGKNLSSLTFHVVNNSPATIRTAHLVPSDVTIDDTAPVRLDPGRETAVAADNFDAFVTARSRGLLRTAYLLTHDHGLAEDLVQTALAKAWFAWSRIEGGDPEPYVRRVMINTYSTWWRRRWNGEQATGELPDSGTDPSPVEQRHDVWQALMNLPRRQRAVIVLRFYEDLTEAQTAEILGCAVGTVKSQTSKALARLRLDPSLIDDRRPR